MLSKPLASEFVPGTPEVPYHPAFSQCGQSPAPGYWQRTCEGVNVPVGYQCSNGGLTTPTHDHSGEPVLYHFMVTGPCRSEFIPTGPPGPVVCTNFPEQPYAPAQPPRIDQRPHFGWNAGANSLASRSGDFIVRDKMGVVVGSVWGITQTREGVPDPARISHGFMFTQTSAGQPRVSVVEGGKVVVPEQPYTPGDEFVIRRMGGRVSYEREGVVIHRSLKLSIGAAIVGCSLFASGDTIP